MWIVCLLVICFVPLTYSVDHGPVDCSMGSRSCDSCHAAYPFCYWCDGQCRRYYGKKIAEIECPDQIMYESCTPKENSNARLDKMMQLLSSVKGKHSSSIPFEQTQYGGKLRKPSVLVSLCYAPITVETRIK